MGVGVSFINTSGRRGFAQGPQFVNSGLELGLAVAPHLHSFLYWLAGGFRDYVSRVRRGQGWAYRVAVRSEGSRGVSLVGHHCDARSL